MNELEPSFCDPVGLVIILLGLGMLVAAWASFKAMGIMFESHANGIHYQMKLLGIHRKSLRRMIRMLEIS